METDAAEAVQPEPAGPASVPPRVGHVHSKGRSDEVVRREYEDKMVDKDGVARGTQ